MNKVLASKSDQLTIIHSAFADIPDLQDGWKDVREVLFAMNESAERQHRKGTPNGCKNGLSVRDGAKYFVVKHLLDGYERPDRFSVDDILSIRNEVLYAQAYAKKFHKELATWYANWARPFEQQVDYVELMK